MVSISKQEGRAPSSRRAAKIGGQKRPANNHPMATFGALPRHSLLSYSRHCLKYGEAEQGLEAIMAKRAQSPDGSAERTAGWLKIKTAKRQEVLLKHLFPWGSACRGESPLSAALNVFLLACIIGLLSACFTFQARAAGPEDRV